MSYQLVLNSVALTQESLMNAIIPTLNFVYLDDAPEIPPKIETEFVRFIFANKIIRKKNN